MYMHYSLMGKMRLSFKDSDIKVPFKAGLAVSMYR